MTMLAWPGVKCEYLPKMLIYPSSRRLARDEFPMGALVEAAEPQVQVVRFVNGKQSNAQGKAGLSSSVKHLAYWAS